MNRLNRLFLPVGFAMIFFSCNCGKETSVSAKVDCISERIAELNSYTGKGQPKIMQYSYNGGRVYYIPPFMPDGYGDLLDTNCRVICHPDGGFTGKGDGKCSDFFSKRTDEKLIWEKIVK